MKNFNLTADESQSALLEIQKKAHHSFKNPLLLDEALTHPSYVAEQSEPMKHNQRLEFLGDAVLQIIVSEYIFKHLPDEQEGMLTRVRSYLTNEQATADYTRKLGLDAALKLSKGEIMTGGRQRPSILGDLFEAFLGAVYLDGGMVSARKLVLQIIPPLEVAIQHLAYDDNPKGALQQWAQANKHGNVSYDIVSKDGPVHNPTYTVNVIIDGEIAATASGHSHKEAEKNAAFAALSALVELTPPTPAADEEEAQEAPAEAVRKKLILALDFDGVICDSAAETAASAWRAAGTLWPKQFKGQDCPPEVIAAFRKIRPFLETGYQSIIMLKMLLDATPLEAFAENLPDKLQAVMDKEQLTVPQLKKLFGATRDAWITADLQGWLGFHGLYPGTIDALKAALQIHKVLILTTKQERFVQAILQAQGVDFPENNIYGLDRKLSKDEVLANLVGAKKNNIHFVEDRLDTLVRIRDNKLLSRVKLHYADWGYGTPKDLEAARADSKIKVLDLPAFCALLS